MAGLNRVMIIGNLGANPETTYTQAGAAITKIAVATSETWNDKNTGEKREKTEWHRITLYPCSFNIPSTPLIIGINILKQCKA